eukprot:757991-Hanusia_phi.AAC.11
MAWASRVHQGVCESDGSDCEWLRPAGGSAGGVRVAGDSDMSIRSCMTPASSSNFHRDFQSVNAR